MLPEKYILELRGRFLEMAPVLSKLFRVCLVPLRKLPSSTNTDEAFFRYALARKYLNDASQVFENRFIRSLTPQDFHVIYNDVLQTIFAETEQRLTKWVPSDEVTYFLQDTNRAINLLLPKIVSFMEKITRSKRKFPYIFVINSQVVSIILYELAKSGLFANCTSDIYAVIEHVMFDVFVDFDETLESAIFLGMRRELEDTWGFFERNDIQLHEEYFSKKLVEDPLSEEDSLLPYWPETIEYSIANLKPLEIRQAFYDAFEAYYVDEQMFIQFDLEVEYVFKQRFEQKFGLSANKFHSIVIEKAKNLSVQDRAQLCKSVQVGRLFLLLTVREIARRFVSDTINRFLDSSHELLQKYGLSNAAAVRLLLMDEFQALEVKLQNRHRASLGMSGYFVWPITLLAESSPRSRKLSV